MQMQMQMRMQLQMQMQQRQRQRQQQQQRAAAAHRSSMAVAGEVNATCSVGGLPSGLTNEPAGLTNEPAAVAAAPTSLGPPSPSKLRASCGTAAIVPLKSAAAAAAVDAVGVAVADTEVFCSQRIVVNAVTLTFSQALW